MEKEIFKDIEGYEGLYQISSLGRVKSLSRIRKNAKGQYMANERFLKTSIGDRGYYRIVLKLNGKLKTYSIHRLIAIAFIPNTENKPFINHKDGDKLNNSIDNLEWCTQSENMIHSFSIGLSKRGENHYISKFNETQVIDIKNRLKNGENYLDIAKIYNVERRVISGIKHNRTWKHIII